MDTGLLETGRADSGHCQFFVVCHIKTIFHGLRNLLHAVNYLAVFRLKQCFVLM